MVASWGYRRRRRRWYGSAYQTSRYFPSGKRRRYSGKYRPHSSQYARAHGWKYHQGRWWPNVMPIGGVPMTRSLSAEGIFGPWTPALT